MLDLILDRRTRGRVERVRNVGAEGVPLHRCGAEAVVGADEVFDRGGLFLDLEDGLGGEAVDQGVFGEFYVQAWGCLAGLWAHVMRVDLFHGVFFEFAEKTAVGAVATAGPSKGRVWWLR